MGAQTARQTLINRPFHHADGQRRPTRNLPREDSGFLHQTLVGHNRVDKANPQGFVSTYHITCQQELQRLG